MKKLAGLGTLTVLALAAPVLAVMAMLGLASNAIACTTVKSRSGAPIAASGSSPRMLARFSSPAPISVRLLPRRSSRCPANGRVATAAAAPTPITCPMRISSAPSCCRNTG